MGEKIIFDTGWKQRRVKPYYWWRQIETTKHTYKLKVSRVRSLSRRDSGYWKYRVSSVMGAPIAHANATTLKKAKLAAFYALKHAVGLTAH